MGFEFLAGMAMIESVAILERVSVMLVTGQVWGGSELGRQRLKAHICWLVTARLKACPDTKRRDFYTAERLKPIAECSRLNAELYSTVTDLARFRG